MHYIRNVVVEQIVLENLKDVIRYVSDDEDEFVQMVMDTDMRQRNKELSQKKKRLTEIHSRIQMCIRDRKWGISERRVQVLCRENRILGVSKLGYMWLIPQDAEKPIDGLSLIHI